MKGVTDGLGCGGTRGDGTTQGTRGTTQGARAGLGWAVGAPGGRYPHSSVRWWWGGGGFSRTFIRVGRRAPTEEEQSAGRREVAVIAGALSDAPRRVSKADRRGISFGIPPTFPHAALVVEEEEHMIHWGTWGELTDFCVLLPKVHIATQP